MQLASMKISFFESSLHEPASSNGATIAVFSIGNSFRLRYQNDYSLFTANDFSNSDV